ncbi:hypothetical protein GQX74_014648 [Glossina fuscipes]|nr:hypothetical protein GQX74_014648 [Glossina fuscipes]
MAKDQQFQVLIMCIGMYNLAAMEMWFAEKKKMLVVVMARFNRCQEAFEDCALLNGSKIGNDIAKRDLSKDTMVKNLRISPRGSYPATKSPHAVPPSKSIFIDLNRSRLASDADIDYIRAHILMKIVTLNRNRYQLSILDLSCLNRFEECLSTFIPRGRKAVKNLAIENDNAVPSTTIGLVTDIVLPSNVPVAKN